MTDYQPGDFPVPRGVVVKYHSTLYTVEDRDNPREHPYLSQMEGDISKEYPDGAAYYLWPVGVPKKFGNQHMAVGWVRRTSFTVVCEEEP